MKWVTVISAHFNLDQVQAFYWSAGKLFVYWQGTTEPDTYADPGRFNYSRLCIAAGVIPLGDDADGKS